MRATLSRCFALGLLSATLGSGAGEVEVSAYYYPWYHTDSRHWQEGYEGQGSEAAPALGEYSSRAPETIRRHLSWSTRFGISHWITSWWGPDSWEDQTLRNHVMPILGLEGEGDPLSFAVFYEAEGLLGLDPVEGIKFDAGVTERFVSHFRFLADHYFSHPSYRRIDGKPVVYLYLTRTFSGDYARAILKARAVVEARGYQMFLVGDEVYWGAPNLDRIRLFDAITAYNMHGPGHYAGSSDWSQFIADCGEVYQTYQNVADSLGVKFIPGVMPGFDTRGRHYHIPREIRLGAGTGSTLQAFLEMAKEHLDLNLREIAVTSFNEWHEGTEIEPSQLGDNGGLTIRQFQETMSSP